MPFGELCQRKGASFLARRAPQAGALRVICGNSSPIQASWMPPCAAAVPRCACRCTSTLSRNSVLNAENTSRSPKSCWGTAPAQSSTSRSDDDPANLATPIAELLQHREHMISMYVGLLADRRVQYRDQVLLNALSSIQAGMQTLLRHLLTSHPEAVAGATEVRQEARAQMTSDDVRRLKETWMQISGVAAHSGEAAMRRAYFRELRDCYATLLCSGLPRTDNEVRLILSEMHSTDLIEPDASFYEAVFIALWSLDDVREATGEHSAAGSPHTSEIVSGEVRQLRRGVAGDLAGHYMGHALAQLSTSSTANASAGPGHTAVRPETWEVFFTTLANAQPAPKLMDLWWKRFLAWLDEEATPVSAKASLGLQDEGASAAKGRPVPYQAAHAVLAWCAQSREMERALNYFNVVNQRGVTLHTTTMPHVSLPSELAEGFTRAGCLSSPSTRTPLQQLQLALLVKLMASTKSIKMDGGLRALVVRDVQRQVTPDVLYTAPWGVINDLISGLSVASAMQLLRQCSSFSAAAAVSSTTTKKRNPSEDRAGDGEAAVGSAVKDRGRREIPFFVWASLLRRCCREHLQDEAESLFLFLRKQFPITAPEKRELIEIMMRMYTTMHPADFPSAMDVFLQHVLRTPEGEPKVEPDAVLYGLLIKSADSRNAAMMVFLEACAAGVALTEEVFEALMSSTQYKRLAWLSRKLPHDYAASSLDAQLKIPANADAHLRREEALRARGKPLYDSTGDVE
ncbi:conserved hypothetical protein [Leishmania braziliensis MHOM/BR/75/M2904]|uniref:Uncharacterized protein n=2 Tax=Leishmania braziliensis TaxID=5660 RepID=A4H7S8_LEIBR|nr:conserved hypothetical protein [Leishmania braziliensis MHOM/BR/75/M2904]CAJ2471247.1 unnamed protein product [Leishmania braziliensis]CAM37595.1 conserved hypothetical protein [Leishmania braziliensis MHOM/BR/75/M2904]SYZ65152.1 hypothetical_protein [Leishmania braziliensis MHOM/BR/75/M2904]